MFSIQFIYLYQQALIWNFLSACNIVANNVEVLS